MTAEIEDLREFLEECAAAILECVAGLPRPETELEAARITATLARNRRYTWASLREALKGYPALASRLPATAGKIDSLPPWGGYGPGKARSALRQGTFVGPHHVTITEGINDERFTPRRSSWTPRSEVKV